MLSLVANSLANSKGFDTLKTVLYPQAELELEKI